METLVEPGQVVNAGEVVIRLAHAGPREASIQLPETLRPAVGSVGRATLFGNKGNSVPATLRQISDAADRLTRTFEARYVLEGPLAQARLGATVTIQIADGRPSTENALQVPIGALFDAGKGPGVWVIDGEPAMVSWQPVTVHQISDDNALITGQLDRGDMIVALGAHLLSEGDHVRLADSNAVAPIRERHR
jgi:RND family efflux transporter MFP subunit